MSRLRRASFAIALMGVLALVPHTPALAGQPVDPSALNPPPPSFESCMATGNQVICQGARTVTDPLGDAGFACGSGPSAFEVYNADSFDQHAVRYYDQNGNLTRRVIHDNYDFGQNSNPLAGTVLPYTQVTNETDDLAVPGDFSSAISRFTGETIFKPAHGKPVLLQVGMILSNIDQTVIYHEAGPDAITDYFLEGDASAFAAFCAALS